MTVTVSPWPETPWLDVLPWWLRASEPYVHVYGVPENPQTTVDTVDGKIRFHDTVYEIKDGTVILYRTGGIRRRKITSFEPGEWTRVEVRPTR